MKYCKNCGKENSKKICSHCGANSRKSYNYCGWCGNAISKDVIICPQCHEKQKTGIGTILCNIISVLFSLLFAFTMIGCVDDGAFVSAISFLILAILLLPFVKNIIRNNTFGNKGKRILFSVVRIILIIVFFVVACLNIDSGSDLTSQKNATNEIYLIGKWKVSDETNSSIEEWCEDGTIIYASGEIGEWRKKGKDEPDNTLSWKANIKESDNSQTYYRVVEDDDFIKFVATPNGDGSYNVVTEVIFSNTTKTFTYQPYND